MQRADGGQLRLLDRESLTNVCSLLDPVTLAKFSCTSREVRDACFQNCLWERLSTNRWQHTNADIRRAKAVLEPPGTSFAQNTPSRRQLRKPSVDFRRLYTSNNGWTPLNLQETCRQKLAADTTSAFCVSRAPASQLCSGTGTGDAVYLLDTEVQLWSTGDCSKEGLRLNLIATGRNHPSIADAVTMTEVATSFVATGDSHGRIFVQDLRPDAGASSHQGTTWHNGRRYRHHSAAQAVDTALSPFVDATLHLVLAPSCLFLHRPVTAQS